MSYVDGYVQAVPTANREAYAEMARISAPLFRDHGALSVVECWGDDVPDGVVTSFPLAVKKEPHETVVFSWIIWPDKATRDAAYPAMEADPRFAPVVEQGRALSDGKRMIFGGFVPIIEA
jgi:uncharacterized protein YbaA (DUF1428 family)